MSQAHRDGARWLIGKLLALGVSLLFWYFVWTPGMLIPLAFVFWRMAKAVY